MAIIVLTCLLLSVALGLSLQHFLLPYRSGGDPARKQATATMVANAVFLTALALLLSDQNPWAVSVVLIIGILLAVVLEGWKPNIAVALSAASLVIYLGLRTAP